MANKSKLDFFDLSLSEMYDVFTDDIRGGIGIGRITDPTDFGIARDDNGHIYLKGMDGIPVIFKADEIDALHVPEVISAFNLLNRSSSLEKIMQNYFDKNGGGGLIEIHVRGEENAESRTANYGGIHLLIVALSQQRMGYRTENGGYNKFTLAHILAHEFVHIFTDLEDGPEHNSLVNQVINEVDGSSPRSDDYFDILSSEKMSDWLAQENHCFGPDTLISMFDGSRKRIAEIRPHDVVASFDDKGRKVSGTVTRIFEGRTEILLNLHGQMDVTPGHLFLCGDGPRAHEFVPIMDILMKDWSIVHEDGHLIRASTWCDLGTPEDQQIMIFLGQRTPNPRTGVAGFRVLEQGLIRLGAVLDAPDLGNPTVRAYLQSLGASVTADGQIRDDATGRISRALHWTLNTRLPRPEDHVLRQSKLTLKQVLQARKTPPLRETANIWNSPAPEGGGGKQPDLSAFVQSPTTPNLNRHQRRAQKAKKRARV